jgi:hypothetical protein
MCAECEGKGKYKILNAYDENYEREIKCEYCGGCGRTYVKVPSSRETDLN